MHQHIKFNIFETRLDLMSVFVLPTLETHFEITKVLKL